MIVELATGKSPWPGWETFEPASLMWKVADVF